jgi:flagellar basal-body rod modification protein FlgD
MSSVNPFAALTGNNGSSNTSTTSTSGSASAANSLTANDFIQFLVTELQNQDPLDPTDSNQMLQQMSEIGQLESSDNLQTSLTGMVQQNQVAAASGMIGKYVQGTDQNSNPITGLVSAVQVTSSGVNLLLNSGVTMPMANVTTITTAPTSTTPSTTTPTTAS